MADSTFSADTTANSNKTVLGTGWLYKMKQNVFPFVITSSKLVSTGDAFNNIKGNLVDNYTGLSYTEYPAPLVNLSKLRDPSMPLTVQDTISSLWKKVSISLPSYKKTDHNNEPLKLYFGYCRGSNGSGVKNFDLCLIKNLVVTRATDNTTCTTDVTLELSSDEQTAYNLPTYLPSYSSTTSYTYDSFTSTTIDLINTEFLDWDETKQNPNPGLLNGIPVTKDTDGNTISNSVNIYYGGVPHDSEGQNCWSGFYFTVTDNIETSDYNLTFDILYNTAEFTDHVFLVSNHNNVWTNKIWATVREIDGTPKTFLMEVVGGDQKSDIAVLRFKCLLNFTTLRQLNVNDKIGKALALLQTFSVSDNGNMSPGDNVFIHSMSNNEKYIILEGTLKNNIYGDGLIFAEAVLVNISHTQEGSIGSPIIDEKGNVIGQLYFEVESLNSVGGTGGFIISRVINSIITQYTNSTNSKTNILYSRSHINFTYEPFDINNSVLDYKGFIVSTPNTQTVLPSVGLIVSLPVVRAENVLTQGDIIQSVTFIDSQDTKRKQITQNVGVTPLYPTLSRAIYRTIPGDTLTLNILRVDNVGVGTNLVVNYITVTPTKEQNDPFDFTMQNGLIRPL